MFYCSYYPIIAAKCKVAKAVSLLARLYPSPFFQYLKRSYPPRLLPKWICWRTQMGTMVFHGLELLGPSDTSSFVSLILIGTGILVYGPLASRRLSFRDRLDMHDTRVLSKGVFSSVFALYEPEYGVFLLNISNG